MSIDYISKLFGSNPGRFPLQAAITILGLFSALHTVSVDFEAPFIESFSGLVEINIPGLGHREFEGGGTLPVLYHYIPVPPGTEPELHWRVNSVTSTGWNASARLSAAPRMSCSGIHSAGVREEAPFPRSHQPVSMEIVHLLGTVAAKITLSPFSTGSMDSYVSGVEYSLYHPDTPGGEPLEGNLLEHLAISGSRWWPYTVRSPESPFWGRPWARIRVNAGGFYSITGQELMDSGSPVGGVPSASLAMFSGPGRMLDPEDPSAEHSLSPVPISVFDGGDGIFHPEDSLLFYGTGLWDWRFQEDSLYRAPHRYDDANTYWLTWGGADGARIPELPSAPSGGEPLLTGILPIGFENEILYNAHNSRTGWLWGFLRANTPGYFYLSSPFASEEATVRLGILNSGRSPWTHNVKAELGGSLILDTLSTQSLDEVLEVTGVSVALGGNMLKVWNDYHGTSYLDYAELLVPVELEQAGGSIVYLPAGLPGPRLLSLGPIGPEAMVFTAEDPFSPVRLTGFSLADSVASLTVDLGGGPAWLFTLEPSAVRKPSSVEPAQPGRIVGSSTRADVLLVLPEQMAGYSPYFESLYAARGKTVHSSTYREIYDEFGQGVSDPGAVRSFVRWALDTWEDPPGMLLLAGDGSSDPLGYTTGFRTLAPVYIETVSEKCYEGFFTAVHNGSEGPEIPVARIPASTGTELMIALEKASQLQDPSVTGPWANRVLLTADDEWGQNSYTETMATINCEIIADSILDPSLVVEKLYLIMYPWPPGTTGEGVHPEKPQAASDLIQMLNSGVSSFSYFGHGSYDQMAMEKLFASGMVSQLHNRPRTFLGNSFSCYTGKFFLPAGKCLSEILLFHPHGGAFANIACTGESFSGQNRTFSIRLFENLYNEPAHSLADALWLAQTATGDKRNLEYALLGDGGIVMPQRDAGAAHLTHEDEFRRGVVNTIDVEFNSETTFFFRCTESADTVTYVSPLPGNVEISYLRYGAPVYSGLFATDGHGKASVDFFFPLQADTGSMGRTDASGPLSGGLTTGHSWPVPVVDTGEHAHDDQGPDIEISFPGAVLQDGIPSVYGNAVMSVVLSDPSGICVLGKDAGSIIICSINGEYQDVTGLFSYHPGSYTTGSLDYTIPDLLPGLHQARIVARDGMKNTGESTVAFRVLEGQPPMLEKTGVYPNPGRGTRAFFFTAASHGAVDVTVYTVAGRPVWQGETQVAPGAGQLVWNGMDADGDQPAAGSYVYVIRYSGSGGTASETDIMVISP